jgi:hypothetical protein
VHKLPVLPDLQFPGLQCSLVLVHKFPGFPDLHARSAVFASLSAQVSSASRFTVPKSPVFASLVHKLPVLPEL